MAGSHEVRGSIPLCSTNYIKARQTAGLFRVLRRYGMVLVHKVPVQQGVGAPARQYGVVAVRRRTRAAVRHGTGTQGASTAGRRRGGALRAGRVRA